MTKVERDYLLKTIIGIKGAMVSETIPPLLKDTLKETLDELYYEKKSCCLVDVTFHLINGDEVCIDNEVSESVTRCEYYGDKIGIPQDFKTEELVPVVEIYRRFTRKHITIPLSSIVRVDMKKSNETNWKRNMERHQSSVDIKRLKDEIAFLKAEYKAVAGCDIKDAF